MRIYLVFAFLILIGLSKILMFYLGMWTPRFHLAPMSHTFSFGNSLNEVRIDAQLKNGDLFHYTFTPGDWTSGSHFGYFVRRDLLSAMQSTETVRAQGALQKLRHKHLCQSDIIKGDILTLAMSNRRPGQSDFEKSFEMQCP